jgi:hypothetical protein
MVCRQPTGCQWTQIIRIKFRRGGSNFDISNPSTTSWFQRNSTGSDDPNRAISVGLPSAQCRFAQNHAKPMCQDVLGSPCGPVKGVVRERQELVPPARIIWLRRRVRHVADPLTHP